MFFAKHEWISSIDVGLILRFNPDLNWQGWGYDLHHVEPTSIVLCYPQPKQEFMIYLHKKHIFTGQNAHQSHTDYNQEL